MGDLMRIPTPGEILNLEFLEPMGITPSQLAHATQLPQDCVVAIIDGGRAITADTALRLARFFGTSAELWLNLQAQYDTEVARRRDRAAR